MEPSALVTYFSQHPQLLGNLLVWKPDELVTMEFCILALAVVLSAWLLFASIRQRTTEKTTKLGSDELPTNTPTLKSSGLQTVTSTLRFKHAWA